MAANDVPIAIIGSPTALLVLAKQAFGNTSHKLDLLGLTFLRTVSTTQPTSDPVLKRQVSSE